MRAVIVGVAVEVAKHHPPPSSILLIILSAHPPPPASSDRGPVTRMPIDRSETHRAPASSHRGARGDASLDGKLVGKGHFCLIGGCVEGGFWMLRRGMNVNRGLLHTAY